MITRLLIPAIFSLLLQISIYAQIALPKPLHNENIPANTPEIYAWWNLLHYSIDIIPDYNAKRITGTNEVRFVARQAGKIIRLDLQEPMQITRVICKNLSLPCRKKEKDAYLVTLPSLIGQGEIVTIRVYFAGRPKAALNPPFDSGWIWARDKRGRPWMSVACEGSGASVWLPCKDVMYDEPDEGVVCSITVPDSLTAVANGRLQGKFAHKDGTATYTWKVINPINSYNIIPYIGKYVTWHKDYAGAGGKLDCDYWVLDYSLHKAKNHLKQADTMLRSFEHWLGAYPFYDDSYKLVEAPMPGMEHQSAIAYGNGFENGYSGKDISRTGWGLKWDFILVHESGHEWFGNSITANNGGDGWIHEGFTKYLEVLYTAYVFGKQAGNEYATGIRQRIKNDQPVIGTGTSDKYYKGSVLLHTIRQLTGDTVFRGWLQALNRTFYHQTVNTEQMLDFLNNYTKKDFTKVLDQYLRTTKVPELEYFLQKGALHYRWSNCVEGFDMPVSISFDSLAYRLIYPTGRWQKLALSGTAAPKLFVDKNFYVETRELKNK